MMDKIKMVSIQHIINKLLDKEIDYSDAFDLIKALPKPWHRPEWKVLRSQVIKDYCEKCGSKDAPFVIQHTVHPPEFRELKAKSLRAFAEMNPKIIAQIKILQEEETYKALSEIVIFSQFNDVRFNLYVNMRLDQLDIDVADTVAESGIERDCCPECTRLVTDRHYRKTWQKYKCEDGHLFAKPNKIIWYKKYRTKDKLEAIRAAKLAVLRSQKSVIDSRIYSISKEVDKEVGRDALLMAFEEHTVYMSMKFTKTYCKSCAFKEDLENGKIR